MDFLVAEECREVVGYLPTQAARVTREMICETCFPYFWEKSSVFPEMDTSGGLGEEKNEIHGNGLAHLERMYQCDENGLTTARGQWCRMISR